MTKDNLILTIRDYVFVTLGVVLVAFGIQYFYVGKNFKGILCLLFCWTFIPSIIAVFSFIITLFRPANEHGDIFIHY